jgi:hypothetical protein
VAPPEHAVSPPTTATARTRTALVVVTVRLVRGIGSSWETDGGPTSEVGPPGVPCPRWSAGAVFDQVVHPATTGSGDVPRGTIPVGVVTTGVVLPGVVPPGTAGSAVTVKSAVTVRALRTPVTVIE